MHLHYLQHVAFEPPGTILDWADAAGARVSATRFFRDEPLPAVADFDWLVIMGGPMNIYEESRYPWLAQEKAFIRQAVERGGVVLGICLGAQLLADALGAKVYANAHREIGWHPVYRTPDAGQSALGSVFPHELPVLHWHGDTFDLPPGAIHLGRSRACEQQAFVYRERVVGLQFHLEATAETLQALMHHCAGELDDGPYVQSPQELKADPARLTAANAAMDLLLNRMADLNTAGLPSGTARFIRS